MTKTQSVIVSILHHDNMSAFVRSYIRTSGVRGSLPLSQSTRRSTEKVWNIQVISNHNGDPHKSSHQSLKSVPFSVKCPTSSFTHSFHKYISRVMYVPGNILSIYTTVNINRPCPNRPTIVFCKKLLLCVVCSGPSILFYFRINVKEKESYLLSHKWSPCSH